MSHQRICLFNRDVVVGRVDTQEHFIAFEYAAGDKLRRDADYGAGDLGAQHRFGSGPDGALAGYRKGYGLRRYRNHLDQRRGLYDIFLRRFRPQLGQHCRTANAGKDDNEDQ